MESVSVTNVLMYFHFLVNLCYHLNLQPQRVTHDETLVLHVLDCGSTYSEISLVQNHQWDVLVSLTSEHDRVLLSDAWRLLTMTQKHVMQVYIYQLRGSFTANVRWTGDSGCRYLHMMSYRENVCTIKSHMIAIMLHFSK